MRWLEGGYRQEWRINLGDAGLSLPAGTVFGFDLSIVDYDGEGEISKLAWGGGAGKFLYSSRLGDLLLLSDARGFDDYLDLLAAVIRSTEADTRRHIKEAMLYQVLFTAVPLTLAILHLFLFLFYRQLRQNFYYAVFTASFGAYSFFTHQVASMSLVFQPESEQVATGLAFFIMISGLRFSYSLFYQALPKTFWGLLGLGLVALLMATQGRTSPFFLLFSIVVFVEMMRVHVTAIARGQEGARIIGVGILAFLIPVLNLSLSLLGLLHLTPGDVGYFYWGFLAITLSMSITLARNFAQTNRSLQTQLIQVRELSEQNLLQEGRLRDEAIRRELLEEELRTAHDMQMRLMPESSPSPHGFDIAGCCLPASHVGGDFFQYFAPAEDRLAISLADVAGHGMEAAVPGMLFSGILETEMRLGDPLEELFVNLNRILHRRLKRPSFICFAMGELDLTTHVLRVSNSGLPYPYHYRAASGDIVELVLSAHPLGIVSDTRFEALQVQLEPGDCVMFCSDGIIEAAAANGELYGFERTARASTAPAPTGSRRSNCWPGSSPMCIATPVMPPSRTT